MVARDDLLSVLLVATPITFVWHLEIAVEDWHRGTEMLFTNGFWEFQPLDVYHVLMYATFGICAVAAIRLQHHARDN